MRNSIFFNYLTIALFTFLFYSSSILANNPVLPSISVNPDTIEVTISICEDSIIVPVTIYNEGADDLIFSTQSIGSDEQLKVVSWYYGADYSPEYINTIAAINEHFTDYTLEESITTDPLVLEELLEDADLLLIGDQEYDVGNTNVLMSPIVQSFVDNGGWMVRFASGKIYLNAIGIFNSTDGELSNQQMTIEDEDSRLLDDVTEPLYGVNFTVMHDFTNPNINVVATSWNDYASLATLEYGSGKAIFIGYDYYSYTTNSSRIVANAVEWCSENLSSEWINTNDSGTISPGDSTIIYVTIGTEDILAGNYVGEFNIESNDPFFPVYSVPVNLTVLDLPCADFTFESLSECEGSIEFINETTETFNSFIWNFGDGSSSTAANPVHVYSEPGNYFVTLIATNDNGSDSLVQEVNVDFYSVSFIYTGVQSVNQNIQFVQVGSASTAWTWFFGDNNSSTISNPLHSFEAAGEYVVTLVCSNVIGCNYSYTDTLLIYDPLEINEHNKNLFQVFPNPNTGSFQIKYSGQDQLISMKLLNKIGQTVYTNKKFLSKGESMEISGLSLAPGLYMLELSDSINQSYIKVIIE